jgi:hypothetical protein
LGFEEIPAGEGLPLHDRAILTSALPKWIHFNDGEVQTQLYEAFIKDRLGGAA